uniref:C-X-C motif chemokine n=1 Tax=Gopherus evgoodei TaxID=1825980 RepID=A0A8C4VYJ6_9SAUR
GMGTNLSVVPSPQRAPVLLSLSPPPRAGAPMAGELRCQCLQTEAAVIHPKRIAHVELIPEGPHCGVPEVIATTKHGKKVCLDPTAPWVKLIVTKIMNSVRDNGNLRLDN